MAKQLLIVESPTKAKTISRFLGKDFRIESSNGHVRDLPKSKMGIEIENGFAPQYVVPRDKQKHVTALKKLAKNAESIFFATDEDREGEAISWHLTQIMNIDDEKIKRITFHEITKDAIHHAMEHPRPLDTRLVDAQQARRILDRLVGYELSPFLWKKVARGLSAGRVQSVAVRLIVEREHEIDAFKPQEYWTIEAEFSKDGETFSAKLAKVDGTTLKKFDIPDEKRVHELLESLKSASYTVAGITMRDTKRSPNAPFTTSTLQQEANRKLGYSSKQTMMLAQQLYEGIEVGSEGSVGLITYMRTDSTNLANEFVGAAKEYISETYSDKHVPDQPRVYTKKQRNAQEAHEAIRPTDVRRTPEMLAGVLDSRQLKLYELIWRRAVASQMADARLASTSVDIGASSSPEMIFRATGSVIAFDGFLAVYPDSITESLLPKLAEKDAVEAKTVKPVQHFTEPPARYSEAGLVKALEEHGIGRPSTYAPIISTIQDRGYVEKIEKRLKPTEIGILVNDVLTEHFPEIVDLGFTATMEKDLDDISTGAKEWVPVIAAFYDPFKKHLENKSETLSKKEITEEATDEVCDKCGKPMVIKMGRFGKFLACTGYPECKNTKPVPGSEEEKQQNGTTIDEQCPECTKPLVMKRGRFGPFLGCSGYPDCRYIKNIEKGTGVTCPECGKGEIIEKRSRRGRTFYSCNQYPACKHALWSKPTGEKCPACKSLIVFAKQDTRVCSNKECKRPFTDADTSS